MNRSVYLKRPFKDKKTTTWIAMHVRFSVSISSSFNEEPKFILKCDPHHLVASFLEPLENLVSQSKAIENLFLNIGTTLKNKLDIIQEKLTQRYNRREQMRKFDLHHDGCKDENCGPLNFFKSKSVS